MTQSVCILYIGAPVIVEVSDTHDSLTGVHQTMNTTSQPGQLSLLPSLDSKMSTSFRASGSGEHSTTAATSGRSEAQADRLGPKVGGSLALVLHSSNELLQ